MLEAVCGSARLAAEGEEVELAAELVLAVAPDGFEVGVGHLREAGRHGDGDFCSFYL